MDERIFYFDKLAFDNPDYSKKLNTFNKRSFPILCALYIALGIYILFFDKMYSMLISLTAGFLMMGGVLIQPIIYKKYGRKYLKLLNENLILKKHYFSKSLSIPLKNINSIQFIGNEFIIAINDSIVKEVKFKAPLDRYLEIREFMKNFSKSYNIRIIE